MNSQIIFAYNFWSMHFFLDNLYLILKRRAPEFIRAKVKKSKFLDIFTLVPPLVKKSSQIFQKEDHGENVQEFRFFDFSSYEFGNSPLQNEV